MIICSVLGKAFSVRGHLREKDSMHDVVNVRALQEDELNGMIEPCCKQHNGRNGVGAMQCVSSEEVAEKSDLLFVEGLQGMVRQGFSVFNSEYIAFHPHQCLPKYEIEYEI